METSSFSSDGRTFCVLGGSRLIGCACPATAAPPTKPGMRHGTVWWLVKMNAAKRVSYGGTAVARSCCACPAAARSYDACPAVARSYNKSLPHDGCGRLHFTKWRRVRDSNSRYRFPRIHAFQACSFNHSDNSPNALPNGRYEIFERRALTTVTIITAPCRVVKGNFEETTKSFVFPQELPRKAEPPQRRGRKSHYRALRDEAAQRNASVERTRMKSPASV